MTGNGSAPDCAGVNRKYACALCGRLPGERCPRTSPKPLPPPRRCPTCDGSGYWPKEATTECLVCGGSGFWKTPTEGSNR